MSLANVFEAGERLRHRGPDESGFLCVDQAVIAHRRLSVVGRSRLASQPLFSHGGSVAAFYNGEIYNHAELGGGGAGASDGQVIAELVEAEGAESLSRLRGMYAAAVLEPGGLVLARDPVGIKPLYWSRQPGRVTFGSEFKSLLGLCPPESIQEFPPGSIYRTQQGLTRLRRIRTRDLKPANLESWVDRLQDALVQAVRYRLMSDGPVGVFLSGGLDSSLVAALARREVPRLHTFAVGLPGAEDLEAAAEVAAYLGSRHQELYLDPEEVEQDLASIIYHLESFDPDLVLSAIPCYYVSRLASQTVKVVLTGEGADELFAGYGYLRSYAARPQLLRRELLRLQRGLYRVNLQRVDRMSMAHGLEARVPFLDLDFIAAARQVPVDFLLTDTADKLVLRLLADRYLPASIAWRPKRQFDQGSGTATLGARAAMRLPHLRTLFRACFPRELERLVARWRQGRVVG